MRYANRAKNIKNKPVINEDPSDAMLREYQDEIKKLKAQLQRMNVSGLESCSRGDGGDQDNLCTEKLRVMKEQAEKEKAEIVKRSKVEMEKMKNEHDQSAKERMVLESRLEKESKARAEMEEQKYMLQKKLQSMEEQLMIGGEMVSMTAKQEASLRIADQELAAKREREASMMRKVAEKEEENFQLNEKYTSLNDEVHSKTKKLKRLYVKYQQAKAEIIDLQREFHVERNDLLETIRDLKKQIKLKVLVIDNFIPPKVRKVQRFSLNVLQLYRHFLTNATPYCITTTFKYAHLYDDEENGGIAQWNEENEEWSVPRLDLAGNRLKLRQRPTSIPGLPRPESEYARRMQQMDPTNPRWRYKNLVQYGLEMPEKTTYRFEDSSKEVCDHIKAIIDMDINYDEQDFPIRPYLKFPLVSQYIM